MANKSRYEEGLKEIHTKLVRMLRDVEVAIMMSLKVIKTRDNEVAHLVFEREKVIDRLEIELEQDCLNMLLLEHPVASDFRSILATFKMITDLERIGDQARDISKIALGCTISEAVPCFKDIEEMAVCALMMVKNSVQSYIDKSIQMALDLDKQDDRVDNLFILIDKELKDLIIKKNKYANEAINLIMIAKYLERIADHAVNIGEWVSYSITGEIVQ